MKPQKYTHRLGQVRVTTRMRQDIANACEAQKMSQADFVRAALEYYLTPGQPPEVVAVPIAGTIKPIDGEYIILPVGLLNGDALTEFNTERPNGQEGGR